MARIAVIGSCITRDLWPLRDQAPADLLYVSRTSLPSLLSDPVTGYEVRGEAHTRYQRMAVETDLAKSGLAKVIEHRPTHLIFDFIDERFDLLALPGGEIITHSWELESGGWLEAPVFAERRQVPRLSEACDRLWRNALDQVALLLQASTLSQAQRENGWLEAIWSVRISAATCWRFRASSRWMATSCRAMPFSTQRVAISPAR